MRFVEAREGHINPLNIEMVGVDRNQYSMVYYDERGEERYESYSFYAHMTSGKKYLLEYADTRDGTVDVACILQHWTDTIARAME